MNIKTRTLSDGIVEIEDRRVRISKPDWMPATDWCTFTCAKELVIEFAERSKTVSDFCEAMDAHI